MLTASPARRSRYFSPYMMVPKATGRAPRGKTGLALEVEFEERTYLLAEPLWVRCSLVNLGSKPIGISYARHEGRNTILFQITGVNSQPAPRKPHGVDSFGPPAVTIPPGQRLVEDYNLYDEYGINDAGDYKITVVYKSDGKSLDPRSRSIRDDLWKGSLIHSLGTVRIVEPTRRADQAALRILAADSDYSPRRSKSRFRFECVFFEGPKCRELIDSHSDSYYAAFAAYYEAMSALEWYENTTNPKSAKPAIPLLESIVDGSYPTLLKEQCLFHLIYAQTVVGSRSREVDVWVRRFREEYPDSPLLSSLDAITK